MSGPVSPAPSDGRLADLVVGEPVSQRHGGREAAALAFLSGRAVEVVASFTLHRLSASTTARTIYVAYQRSVGAQALLISIVMAGDDVVTPPASGRPGGFKATVAIGATFAVMPIDLDGCNGTTPIPLQNLGIAARVYRVAVIDVSEVDPGSVQYLSITVDDATSSHCGLQQIHVEEVPLFSQSPAAGTYPEPGVEQSWPDVSNTLEAGSSSSSRGMARLLATEREIAKGVRWHWQIPTYEDTSLSWQCASAFPSPPNFVGTLGTSHSPLFYARAKRLYAVATGMRCTMVVRYLAVSGGFVRIIATPTAGAPVNLDLTLPASGSFTSASVTVTVPTSGTDQEVTFEIVGSTANVANPVYLSNIALIEDEL